LTNIPQIQNKYSIAEEKALTTGGIVTFNLYYPVVETERERSNIMRPFPAPIDKLKPIYSVSRSHGKVVRTIIPKKLENVNNSERETMKKTEETVDPVVAFSKPPPFTPFVGPLLVYSLLQSWFSGDEDG
ncbi:hypothetical protein IGI04_031210, partial [Brassica rapa subsp. trilocularis]